ncbi:MAG: HupE/UreJ family protein [Akkermansiaceae bacterium]
MVWRWRPILIQALVFTVAQSVTLGLVVSGVIPKAGWPGASSLVESIIALSIASLAF